MTMSQGGGPGIDDGESGRRESRASRRFQILEAQGLIVGRTLGSGSYACVKSAYDINKKCKVAIKIISKRKAPEDYLLKFLPREIEVVRVLRHPNLIQFHQVIETTTRFFLVMEISENGDLLEHIRRSKIIEEWQSAKWMRHLYDGMTYMHSRGIVHRDLKCENLLVDMNKILRITDFGFAKKLLKGKGNEHLSETYCGSYAYAPPEILKGVPYNPFIAEVWSIGVVLFTMVYGRLPFDDSDHKKLLKQVQAKVMFPSKPDVTENCRILILKMLTKSGDRIPLGNIRFDAWYKQNCVLPDDPVPNRELVSPTPPPKAPTPEQLEPDKEASSEVEGETLDTEEPIETGLSNTVAQVQALGKILTSERPSSASSDSVT